MGKIKKHKPFLYTMKAVQIFVVLVIFSQMNCFKMPSAVCKPMKKLGTQVATDVLNCARNSKLGKKATRLAKGKVKLPKSADLANKMVSAIASKVGCRRRMWSLGGMIHSAAHFVKKVGSGVLHAGLKMACKTLKPMCPKACDAGISKITPMMEKFKIPTKCFKKVALKTCKNACNTVCKRRLVFQVGIKI